MGAEILWRRGRVLSHYGSMSSAQWQQLGLWCAANCQPRLLGSSVGNSSESNAAIPVEEEGLMETSSGGSYCVAQHIQNHAIGRCYSSYQPATNDYTGNQGSKWAEILWRRGRVISLWIYEFCSMAAAWPMVCSQLPTQVAWVFCFGLQSLCRKRPMWQRPSV